MNAKGPFLRTKRVPGDGSLPVGSPLTSSALESSSSPRRLQMRCRPHAYLTALPEEGHIITAILPNYSGNRSRWRGGWRDFVIFKGCAIPAGQLPRNMLIISLNTKPLGFKYSLSETQETDVRQYNTREERNLILFRCADGNSRCQQCVMGFLGTSVA